MTNSPKIGEPIARMIETQKNGKTRVVGTIYRWDNGLITQMFTIAKKEINGTISALRIEPEEIARSRTAA